MRDLFSVNLQELLPPSIANDPNILAAAEGIDAELHKATERIPGVSIIPRIREIVDSTLINLLGWQFHVDFFGPDAPLEVRRELVARSLDWHTRKGTPSVVEEVVTAALADSKLTEWFEYGGMPYNFRITTEMPITSAEDIRTLIRAIFSVKNTRSWLDFIEALTRAVWKLHWGTVIYDEEDWEVGLRPIIVRDGPSAYIGGGVILRTRLKIEPAVNMTGYIFFAGGTYIHKHFRLRSERGDLVGDVFEDLPATGGLF